MHSIELVSSHYLVRGLLNLSFKIDELCKSCTKGKKTKASFKLKNVVSTSQPIELLHIDLCGPMHVKSPEENSLSSF